MPSPRIRPARPSDLADLAVLEVEAGQLFHSVGMSEVADHVPDHQALRRSHEEGLIWVAEQQGKIAGYIVATVLDGNAHVEQVSVAPAYARRGIGRQLMSHAPQATEPHKAAQRWIAGLAEHRCRVPPV